MLTAILKILGLPLIIGVYTMAAIEAANIMEDKLNQKKYVAVIVAIILATILAWPFAILTAIIFGYKTVKKKKAGKEEEKKKVYTPQPGSAADYERWKAKREQGKTEG